jgi:21S rRNA (uridine2791-2'-O)-methyltransferase
MIVSLRTCCPKQLLRTAFSRSSSSSTRWKARQTNDAYAREARVAGLKSRAAFKLLEIHSKYRIFRRGDTVVDLGFAPGSWSQVAVSKTNPGGRVVGIDVIPAQPPPGANALQGNFLSMEMRDRLREFVGDQDQGRVGIRGGILQRQVNDSIKQDELTGEAETQEEQPAANEAAVAGVPAEDEILERHPDHEELAEQVSDEENGRVVNVVLSDMSEPWPLLTSTWIKSVNIPYLRMMNTSGMAFRDHAGSMVRSHLELRKS